MTYVEEEHIVNALETLANESGLTLSNLIRQATWEYTKKVRTDTEVPPITRDKTRSPKKAAKKPGKKK